MRRPHTKASLRAGIGLLLLYDIRAIDVAEIAQRTSQWVSMGLSGYTPWSPKLEAALLIATDGDRDFVERVRLAAETARQHRQEPS